MQIGVNTAIYSPSGGSVGVGFAIPPNRARPVIEQLMVHGRVSRSWLGVQTQELTPAIAHYLGQPDDHGALVADVSKGRPADRAGIQQGDVIKSFAGEEIVKLRDLTRIIADTPAGRTVTVKVWRRGHEVTLEPTIVEQPEHPESAIGGGEERPTAPQRVDALGLGLGVLTPELRKLLSVPAHVKGVVVMQVSSSSPFASIDLQPGDVIISINQEPVLTPQEAATKLKAAQSRENKGTLFHLNREGTNLYVGWPQRNNGG